MHLSKVLLVLLSLTAQLGCGVVYDRIIADNAARNAEPLPQTIAPVLPMDQLRWRTHPKDATPPKVAWLKTPVWTPVRNDFGIVTGRTTNNHPLIMVFHQGLSTIGPGELPEVCSWELANLTQQATDNSGANYAEQGWVTSVQMAQTRHIDCDDYRALP